MTDLANPKDVNIQMLYFASARTSLDKSSETLSFPRSFFNSPNEFKEYLLKTHYNDNAEFKTVLNKSAISLNEEIVYDDEGMTLKDGDVVAIIPPVSGG
ncbi:hypothetical protein P389DRAFT_112907 [Cystobasidium minutum MCA 4210]|uniref:uncharacterized protein n=1 Tax=Cystobasidium minutum MCA 4210 TaxID=1397322 RepID=UPI0034CFA432|eukprot:jgi/Rhomi1/112907/CE112906_349